MLPAIFGPKLKYMTCWNDCTVQERYSKQTLMMLINGVNEVLTGRVSFHRQCSMGIMANVSGYNYIYYTLSYGILAGLWRSRAVRMEIKAVMLKEPERCWGWGNNACQFPLTKKQPCFRETIAPSSGQKQCIARGEISDMVLRFPLWHEHQYFRSSSCYLIAPYRRPLQCKH